LQWLEINRGTRNEKGRLELMIQKRSKGKMQNSYKYKIFRIYFLFLIPIIIISLFSYSYIKQRFINEANSFNNNNLHNISLKIENDIYEFERLSYLVIKNMHRDNIENLTIGYETQNPNNIYKLQNTQSMLISLKSAKENLQRVLIHVPKSDMLISDDGVYKVGEYYDIFPNFKEADQTFIKHETNSIEYLKIYSTTRISNDRKSSDIKSDDYTDTIPITISYKTFEGINANVLMNIRESYISGLLNNTTMIKGTQTLIVDDSGQLISHTDHDLLYHNELYKELAANPQEMGKEVKISGKKFILYGNELSFPHWTVYSLIPHSEYYQQLNFIKILLVFINLALLGSGLLAAYFFSNRLYSPIRNFIEILSNKATKIDFDEIEFINENMKTLKSTKKELENKLDKIKPMIKENIVKNIVLYGDQSVTEQEVLNLLNEHDIQLDSKYYLMGICHLYYSRVFGLDFSEEDQKSIRKKIVATIGSLIRLSNPGHCLFIEIEEFRFLIIINSDDPKLRECLLASFDEINELLQADRVYLKLTLSVSEPLPNLLSLADVYHKVNARIQFTYLNMDEFLIDENALKQSPALQLPQNFEEKLKNVISYGYEQDIQDLVDQVLDSNLRQSLTPFMFNRIINFLFYEIEKVLQYYGIHIDLSFEYRADPLLQQYDTDGAKTFFISLLVDMNRLIQQNNPAANKKVLLGEYIEANYVNENLDLQIMADTLRFNPNYLSRLFKEQTGKTFTDYVSDIRINKAKELITQTDLSIEDIGKGVGISNRRTFNRTFKKITGASPTLYRIIKK
jgi:two-component system response regulator YesN